MSLEDLSPEAINELALLSRQLAENPKTRKSFLKLTREARPDLPVPELDIEEQSNAVLKQAEEKVSSLESRLMERDARDELEKRRQRLISKGLVGNEDEIAEVEKVMLEKKIPDHETAAEYWRFMKQAATPTPSAFGNQVLDKGTRSVLSKYWKNPAAAAREEAAQALHDIRRGAIKIG